MANITLVKSQSRYLEMQVVERLKTCGHFVTEVALDVKELSRVGSPEALLLFVCSETEQEQQALIYLKDICMEKETPIFILGYPDDNNAVRKVIPDTLVQKEFVRPFDVHEIADFVDRFVRENNEVNKKKILIVDDDGIMLRNMKQLLGKKYQIILANSGAMAIKHLAMGKPDLMLLDYEMPLMDGKQLLSIIRSENDFDDIPVMFLTGKSDKESIMGVLELKPAAYLLKSMPADKFLGTIDEFFEKQRMSKMG